MPQAPAKVAASTDLLPRSLMDKGLARRGPCRGDVDQVTSPWPLGVSSTRKSGLEVTPPKRTIGVLYLENPSILLLLRAAVRLFLNSAWRLQS